MGISRNSTIRLNAKFKPKQCEVCGRTFVPFSGRARRCDACRYARRSFDPERGYQHRKGRMSVEMMAACLDDLDLIADVKPDYALGRRRGLTDEETERRARAALTWAINRILEQKEVEHDG